MKGNYFNRLLMPILALFGVARNIRRFGYNAEVPHDGGHIRKFVTQGANPKRPHYVLAGKLKRITKRYSFT